MRTKKAFYNTLLGIIYQVIMMVCAFILPRLILDFFGSSYNGLIVSINQYLSWGSLLSAGVGGVTRAALYRPLAENNIKKINEIIRATDSFMKKVAIIFIGLLVIFAIIYPYILRKEFSYSFVFSLILILGINIFSQYYFGMTYQLLLEADQRQYICIIIRSFTTILGTFLASILILLHFELRLVYLITTIIYSCNPVFLNIYVKKYYKIDKKSEKDNIAISERWNAFAQEIAIMLNNNTDIVILSIFNDIKIVSVYSIYNMIVNGVRQIVQIFTTGVGAAFGNMLAQKLDNKILDKNLKLFEMVVINVTTILFSVAGVTIVPFVLLYVKGIYDIEYKRVIFSYLILLASMFNCYRIPYQTIVYAAGKFKETRNGSILEVTVNIVVSLILVNIIGLNGVIIGTIIATIFRTFQYGIYLSKNIIVRKYLIIIKNIMISLSVFFLSNFFLKKLFFEEIETFLQWIILCLKCFIIVLLLMLAVDFIFYKKELKEFFHKLFVIILRKS